MADRYIDQDEILIYGPYGSRKMRTKLLGLVPACDGAVSYFADAIDEVTKQVREAIEAAHAADTSLRDGVRRKQPALVHGIDVLRRFSRHLDAQAGPVDRKRFFRGDGTFSQLGKSGPRVLLALNHIGAELKKKDAGVSEAAAWHKQVTEAAAALAPVLDHADNARTDRRDMTPEVAMARAAWLQTYTAAKALAEAILRMVGKLDQMPRIFYDLAVPSTAKVTAPPDDADTLVDDADAGEPSDDDAADAAASPPPRG